jgi:predicted phage-related endonuclease
MEPVIAGKVMDEYGWALDKVPTVRHRDHEFLVSSVDRLNQDRELVEIKTSRTGNLWGEPETADVPQYYWLQGQHQLEVLDVEVCWFFVLIGGSDFRRYRVVRDSQYLDTVYDPLRDFWDHVERREPPDPDWSHPTTLSALNRMYVPQAGKTIELSDEQVALADEYDRLGVEIKDMEAAREEAKCRLIHVMGEAEKGLLPDGRIASRKQITVNYKAKEASTAIQTRFQILKAKG